MDKRELLNKAFPALLKAAERSPVQIIYRGVDDNNKPLYEVSTRAGESICRMGTDKQILTALIEKEAK